MKQHERFILDQIFESKNKRKLIQFFHPYYDIKIFKESLILPFICLKDAIIRFLSCVSEFFYSIYCLSKGNIEQACQHFEFSIQLFFSGIQECFWAILASCAFFTLMSSALWKEIKQKNSLSTENSYGDLNPIKQPQVLNETDEDNMKAWLTTYSNNDSSTSSSPNGLI